MKGPYCRVVAFGEFSLWSRQFLNTLQSHNVLEIGSELNAQEFLSKNTSAGQILFLDNSPDSRKLILKLKESNHPLFIVWIGRVFTKEDYVFALDQRIYCIFENIRADDKHVIENIQKVSMALENAKQFGLVLRSLKSVLLEMAGDVAEPVLNELKTAASKIEQYGLQNEFTGKPAGTRDGGDLRLFSQSENFSEALTTIHNLEQTGILWVRGMREQEGQVEFIQGRIISAQTDGVKGLKAIYRIFLWDEPRFVFSRRRGDELNIEEQIPISMQYICMEGTHLKGRFEKIRREIPPLDLTLELEPLSLHANTALSHEELQTLASVVEFGRVSLILDYNPLTDVSLYESLICLKRTNCIRVAA